MANQVSVERAIGLCLGASTLSAVEIERRGDDVAISETYVMSHEGDPKRILAEFLDGYDFDGKFLAMTGRKFRKLTVIPSITEPEATELAYQFVNRDSVPYDAVVSAGGESFMVYQIDRTGRISRVSSGNKCASGTGEFFLQQIRRMAVDVDEAVALARSSEQPYELSGRCSVFCKSDCTHALNKGRPVADVAAGLARMIARKIEELLVRVQAERVLMVGGTARNGAVVDWLRKGRAAVDVPAEAPFFEALGAALWALRERQDRIPAAGAWFREGKSSFEFLPPLSDSLSLVDFRNMPLRQADAGDRCILGLDVGSTTTKAVLLREADDAVLASVYLRTSGNPVKASRACYAELHRQLDGTPVDIVGLGVTGSGRNIAGLHADTETVINEIIAHARAAARFDPEVNTIFEIGGQDAKYTYLTNAVASDYAMNEACSAGTGSFLEESAFESLGIRMEEIADLALGSKRPPNFSDQCAAFISADIKTALQEGIPREDIVAGLVYSICINYANRVKGARQVGDTVFMQGGVCYNRAVPVAMAAITGKRIVVPPHPGLMGAYGVALEVKGMLSLGLAGERRFDLAELSARDVEYGKSFICRGGKEKCDRKCEIAMIHVAGKRIPFGGACNKYYTMNRIGGRPGTFDQSELDHIALRRRLVFERFAPAPDDPAPDAPTVGINRSFQTHTLYPMFHAFFTELGCRMILPERVDEEAARKGTTSFCLSGQIALGMFSDLLSRNPDYIFMPQIMEMHVTDQESYRKEYQTVCMFVQGEPFFQKATFLRNGRKQPVMLTPALNFMRGFETQEEVFVQVAAEMGFSRDRAVQAYAVAVERQKAFFRAMKEEGRRILDRLEKDPDRFAVVLFGRPYNAFTGEANKGIPAKFASLGIEILPYDFLPYEQEENYKDTYWEMGQRIIRAARIVKRHPQLFGCYLTNFLCALDSMMVPHFRDLMQTKPSLTIEVDEHTADAGVNTRIEAFLDVVTNYRKIRERIRDSEAQFRSAQVEVSGVGAVEYIDSEGERFPIRDPRVRVIVPSMGDLFGDGAAAALRSIGWNAEALPQCDREALDLGRSVTTSKECLPIINIIGELLKYLKYRKNPDEKLAMLMVAAGGCCRVGQYRILLQTVIDKLGLKNVALVPFENDSGYAGLGLKFRLNALRIIFAGDVMDDIRSAIKAMVVDREAAMEIHRREWRKIIGSIDGTNPVPFYRQLRSSARELSAVRLERPISEAKYVGVIGEIFVRRDHFSLMGIPDRLAANGFVMLDAHVMEWSRYTDFLREIGMFEARTTLLGRIERAVGNTVQDFVERKIKRLLAESGLYEMELLQIRRYMRHSQHLFPWTLTGEPGLSSGAALYHLTDKWCGVINVGPFGCMNSRMTEAVATAEMTMDGKYRAASAAGETVSLGEIRRDVDVLPFLSIECDGNPFPQIIEARFETFLLQADRLYAAMLRNRESRGGDAAVRSGKAAPRRTGAAVPAGGRGGEESLVAVGKSGRMEKPPAAR